MEVYRKLTPTSRGKSKGLVESSLAETLSDQLMACRDVDPLACAQLWALQMIDRDDLGNEISSIPFIGNRCGNRPEGLAG